jgi:S-adenosylmethionine-diacylglycerol 3-amino-3-carboxypropyl transferase
LTLSPIALILLDLEMKKIDGIRYSMSWEDPSFLFESLQEGDRVLMIGSGGCMSLNALTRSPSDVQVIDINPDQIRLIELKKAAIESFDYQACMDFLGCFEKRRYQRKRFQYFEQISSRLSTADRMYWDMEMDKIARGIIHEGKFERYLRFFSAGLSPFIYSRKLIRGFLNSKEIKTQQEIYKNDINTWRYRLIFRWFFGKLIMRKFGRHPQLLKHVKGQTSEVFYKRIERAWCEIPIAQNYFFRYILQGYFDQEQKLPFWLQTEQYQNIKAKIKDLKCSTGSMVDFLSNTQEESWDLIYLSNITETMDNEESQQLFDLCRRSLKKSGKMILWNNLVERRPKEGFKYLDRSDKLWEERIDSLYGFAAIYQKND